jgi:hypothetical protein
MTREEMKPAHIKFAVMSKMANNLIPLEFIFHMDRDRNPVLSKMRSVIKIHPANITRKEPAEDKFWFIMVIFLRFI